MRYKRKENAMMNYDFSDKLTQVLEEIKEAYCSILTDNLVGIYVHGSIALGGFHWTNSDIDFLAVVKRRLTFEEKQKLMESIVSIHKRANPRGLEMSIVREKYCKEPVFPVPFELHFSGGTLGWYQREPEEYCKNMIGEDSDLGAHMAVIKQSGIVLYGEPVDAVFGDIPENIYRESVMSDLEDARENCMDDFAYHTLNLCRTIAYLEDGIIRSKKAGGEWGIENLPQEFRKLISAAVDACCKGVGVSEEEPGDREENVRRFCEYSFERMGLSKKVERRHYRK